MQAVLLAITDILTCLLILSGLFFLVVGAFGLVKLPDLYNRIHASSKCVTLGISGILLAAAIGLSTIPGINPLLVISKAALVIIFQFIASPVSAHLLSKAAHLDQAPQYTGTVTDELEEDYPH